MPLVVLVLISGAVFFTLRFAFINIRGVLHAVQIVRGIYDDPTAEGEVSHFQALSSALSATVGLGNIAGVAIAVSIGGPGAVFWMMAAAFFGMTSKFAECTLGQMYRQVDEDGHVVGGPMVYLRDGLAELGFKRLGVVLSTMFAVLCILGSFGGGNMFQANQSFLAVAGLIPALGGGHAEGGVTIYAPKAEAISFKKHLIRFQTADGKTFQPVADVNVSPEDWKDYDGMWTYRLDVRARASGPEFNVPADAISVLEFGVVEGRNVKWTAPEGYKLQNAEALHGGSGHLGWLYGLLLAVLVGLVIVGGIKRIGAVADKIVPFMCVLYVLCGMVILLIHHADVPHAVALILGQAFNPDAMYGGALGVFITGVKRAAFSNEAGVGSAAIAHSAARTKYPVREGLVALLEPFIDTIVICFMTGIVVVITGVYADPTTAGLEGVELTAAAFEESLSSYASLLLSVSVILFAFSTMISWSYYGERCWSFLFGKEQAMPYRYLFCFFVWLGCVSSLQNVLDFSDLMILSMAFPNIIGAVMLSGKVKRALDDYMKTLKTEGFQRFK
ncbi:MAG: alanine/glycine:cation symporter family protein [bacterium]